MKNLILFTVIVLLSTLNSACRKDDDGDQEVKRGTITAKIDGETFEAAASGSIITLIQQLERFTIAGVKITNLSGSSGQVLTLVLDYQIGNEPSTDSYTSSSDCDVFSNEVCPALGYGDTADPNGYGSQATPFTVTIDEIDYRLGGFAKGSFSDAILFDVDGNSVTVTDGKFNVSIQ